MKTLLFLLMCIPLTGLAKAGHNYLKPDQALSGEGEILKGTGIGLEDSIAPDTTGMRDLSSVDLSKEMIPGWNVGNSLDAIGGETEWGNPLISQRLIDSIKAAGFKSVRIPVAWSKFTDADAFIIDTAWMDRVEEVVNYVLSGDLYAVMNIHWDGGWMQPTFAEQEYVNNRLAVMWHQIAVRFRDYGDRLLFAGSNEVLSEGDYGAPSAEYAAVQNSFNQTFVSTVRSTGGRNFYRHLVVQGYNTNINYTVNNFTDPVDAVEDRLMVEVHYYDPYNFTLNTSSGVTQWGMYATNPLKTETWANESYADGQFRKMRTNFADKGYGVILGEYGVIARLNLGSEALNADHAVYRRYYIEYITHSIVKHGLVPFYWDNGYTGNNSFGLFNRNTGAGVFPDMIKAIVSASDTNHIINNLNTSDPDFMLLYPNPAHDILNLEVYDGTIQNARIYNSNGRLTRTLHVEQGLNTYDISDLRPGLYFIKIFTSEGTMVQKVMKN